MAAEPFVIFINPSDLARFRSAMERLAAAGHDLGPVMRSIAIELLSQTEANFAAEGRPAWADLAASTIASRTKTGHWPGKKEQVSGQLAASTITDYGPSFAAIGQSKIYAAIQNLGGDAGRGHHSHLPPRPSLPITSDGNLQPEAKDAIMDVITGYLARVIGN